jgi:hypothetical protein
MVVTNVSEKRVGFVELHRLWEYQLLHEDTIVNVSWKGIARGLFYETILVELAKPPNRLSG